MYVKWIKLEFDIERLTDIAKLILFLAISVAVIMVAAAFVGWVVNETSRIRYFRDITEIMANLKTANS